MDSKNNGNPYFLMDDLGVKPPIFGNIHMVEPHDLKDVNIEMSKVGFDSKTTMTKGNKKSYLQVDEQQYKHTLETQRNSSKNTQHVVAIV